jgi:phospholipid/cholesterol/gamma-HCH transport system substrate-binding protein
METRANYALIGLFTLAVIGGLLTFVYWFAAGRSNGEKNSYRIVFQGSVSGLIRGSVVRFNGLRVGEVVAIDLVPEDPSRVQAIIELDAKTPVRGDTRARLEYQGLTGQASVQLTGGTLSAPRLTTPDGSQPTIFADRSDFQDLLETAQRLAGRLETTLTRVERIVADNEASINGTIRGIETFAKALADNAAGVGAFLASVGDTAQRISSLSGRLETLAVTAEELLRGIDARSVNRTLTNVESFTEGLAENRENLSAIMSDGATLAKRLADASQRIEGTLGEIEKVAKAIDGEVVGRTLGNIDRFAASLGSNAGEVDRVLKDASQIAATLRVASERLDAVMVAAQRFLGANEGEAKGALGEVAETARAFRDLAKNLDVRAVDFSEMAKSIERLARNLDRRTAEITSGINRLTSGGGRDIEALTTDARRAVGELNRAVRNIARDPSQIIRGGRAPIPEYSGTR